MNVAEKIEKILKSQERNPSWLAEKIEVPYHTLRYRLINNCLLAEDLIKIGKVLSIDLNELKEEV